MKKLFGIMVVGLCRINYTIDYTRLR